jgi:protein-tyrosine phosphatase
MHRRKRRFLASALKVASFTALCLLIPAVSGALSAPLAERLGPDHVRIHWLGDGPVDVYVSSDPDASINQAERVAFADATGIFDFRKNMPERPYFILRDERDGSVLRVAERNLPLERGSNFRDAGGYEAADGKHVRWGMIYRSAAAPELSGNDYRYLNELKIKADVDLRSTDERSVSPDLLPTHTGARYLSSDYSLNFSEATYHDLLRSLAPQFREMFQEMFRNHEVVIVHCTAGQDRTGIAIALVLSALGVPRDVIVQDYLLSMQFRRPKYEVERMDPAEYPGNSFVEFVSKTSDSELYAQPYLYDAAGEPYLEEAFNEIDRRWGSVQNYLNQELGVTAAQIAQLRAIYLE